METTITVDKAGRLVLPKQVRLELHLEPGDTLELVSDSRQVTLRPSRGASRLRMDRGYWVFTSGTPISASDTDQVLEEIRRSREER